MSFSHIEGILYINLEHRKDRKRQMLRELAKLQIEKRAERIDAEHNLLNGHIGCCMSHLKALHFAKAKRYRNVLILEDDVVFTSSKKEIENEISYFFAKFQQSFDVFFLGVNVFEFESLSDPKIKRVLCGQAAHAYVVSSNYYDTLIDCFQKSLENMQGDSTFDESLFKAIDQEWKNLQCIDRWYVGKIHAQQRRSYSDIFHQIKDRVHSDII